MSVVSKDNRDDVPEGFRNIKISAARKALCKFGNILNTKNGNGFYIIDKLQKNMHITIIRKMRTKFFCEDDICYELVYNTNTENFDNLSELTNWFVEKNPLIFPDNVEDKTSVSHKDVSHYKPYMNSKIITTMCVVLCIFIVKIY